MESKTAQEIFAALKHPFAPEDLEWRLQHVKKETPYGLAVPYVTNRAIQNRLDDVVGPGNWYNEYKPWHQSGEKASQLCGISIYFEETQRWVTKWDGAEDSDIEPVKGGLSDSMKRAAVQWGIGRILYEMDAVFVDVEQRGKTWVIPKKEQSKMDSAYLDMLKRKGLTPAGSASPQPQSKPRQAAENPKSKPQPTPQAKGKSLPPESKASAPKATSDAPSPSPIKNEQEETIYTVVTSQVQPGIGAPKTRLILEAPDGKRLSPVYVRGAHPELADGVALTNVRLVLKKEGTVAFYILADYQVAPIQEAA